VASNETHTPLQPMSVSAQPRPFRTAASRLGGEMGARLRIFDWASTPRPEPSRERITSGRFQALP
jgi:hypothetical protein